jgi:hypothetical protein
MDIHKERLMLSKENSGTEESMPKQGTTKSELRSSGQSPKLKPLCYLSSSYNDDNEFIGYTVWPSGTPVYTKAQIIEACANFIHQRMTERHGWDKYGDAHAVMKLKGLL